MKRTGLLLVILFLFGASQAFAGKKEDTKEMNAPAYSALPAATLRIFKVEGVTEQIYNKIKTRSIVTVRKPTPKGKSGAAFMSYGMVAGSPENAWEGIDNCKEMTKFTPHFAECENTVPSVRPPPQHHDGLFLKYTRNSKNVIKFSLVTVTMHQDVWVNKPNVLMWRRARGDMKYNEGYWRIVKLAPKLIVMVYSTLTDVGRLVPDFMQKTLTEKDLPNSVRTMRKHIEDTLEKRNP